MKLSNYIKGLQEILDKHGNIDCWYSADDEGNSYQVVNHNGFVAYHCPDEGDYRVEYLYRTKKEAREFLGEDYGKKVELVKVCLVN